jgi:hypothetical protein
MEPARGKARQGSQPDGWVQAAGQQQGAGRRYAQRPSRPDHPTKVRSRRFANEHGEEALWRRQQRVGKIGMMERTSGVRTWDTACCQLDRWRLGVWWVFDRLFRSSAVLRLVQ